MIEQSNFLHLSRETLENLDISTNEVVESIEHLIRGAADSKVWHTPKSVILPPDGRYMMSTLSAADDPGFLAVKSVIVNNRNPELGLPPINGLITLLDSNTGMPVAVVDGNWVTAIRTAGASAIAAKQLARKDSASIAFIGCGVQAYSHLKIYKDLFPLKEVRAVDLNKESLERFCDTAQIHGFETVACDSFEDAINGADIIVSCVSLSREIKPFLDGRTLKPGVFACSVDLGIPWMDEGMAAFDRVIIDDLEQEASSPDALVPAEVVKGDLNQLVTGQCEGRINKEERTAFVFRAVALGDLALAGLAYQKASVLNRGQALEV